MAQWYVNKVNITGLYANASADAQDLLDESDPLIVAYLAKVNAPITPDPVVTQSQVNDKIAAALTAAGIAPTQVAAAQAAVKETP